MARAAAAIGALLLWGAKCCEENARVRGLKERGNDADWDCHLWVTSFFLVNSLKLNLSLKTCCAAPPGSTYLSKSLRLSSNYGTVLTKSGPPVDPSGLSGSCLTTLR